MDRSELVLLPVMLELLKAPYNSRNYTHTSIVAVSRILISSLPSMFLLVAILLIAAGRSACHVTPLNFLKK
jgi:hypothetical protein